VAWRKGISIKPSRTEGHSQITLNHAKTTAIRWDNTLSGDWRLGLSTFPAIVVVFNPFYHLLFTFWKVVHWLRA